MKREISNHVIHVFAGNYGDERWWTHTPGALPPETPGVVWIDLGWWRLEGTRA